MSLKYNGATCSKNQMSFIWDALNRRAKFPRELALLGHGERTEHDSQRVRIARVQAISPSSVTGVTGGALQAENVILDKPVVHLLASVEVSFDR